MSKVLTLPKCFVVRCRDEAAAHLRCAAMDKKESLRLRRLAREASRIQGRRWVDVTAVELEVGKLYIARRSYSHCGRLVDPDVPVLSRWIGGRSGWQDECGCIQAATSGTIQVWSE